MSDDLLGDILRATTGEAPAPRAATGIGDILGQAVSRPARPAARVEAPDLTPLSRLDDAAVRALLRYLPADQVVPLLAHAPVAVANRVVGGMDAEARAWLSSQNDEIEAVTPERHAAAAAKALALLPRLGGAPPRPSAPVQAAPSLPVAPVATAFSVGGGPTAPVSEPEPVTPAPPAADQTLELLVELVEAARGRRPGELRQLATGLDHPVLAEGLLRVAEGVDPHDLDAAMRAAAADHLIAEERRLDLIRRAVMAIRFGDHGDALRR